MATNFPAYKPVSRTFTPAKFPTKRFASINGAGTTRLYGSKAFDAKLDLEFTLDDTAVEAIIKCWNDAYGSYDSLNVPEEIFSGMNTALYDSVASDLSHLKWRWDEGGPPTIQGLSPSLSRVSVRLIATLETI